MGTRGRPYTDYFPKAMMPVEGRPAIARITDAIMASGVIGEIIILTDLEGLGGQIRNYFGENPGGGKISFVQDSQSGTGGDLLHVASRLRGEQEFLLWFADNLCGIDIAKMRRHFLDRRSLACIATRTKRREETGFARVSDGRVYEFQEKPLTEMPMSECLGIYILSTKILGEIRKKKGHVNLSYDILEGLSKKGTVSAFDIGNKPWIDAESPAVLERNKELVRKITRQMGR